MRKRIRVNGILYEAVDKDSLVNVKIPGYGKSVYFDSGLYIDEGTPLVIDSDDIDAYGWDTMFDGGHYCNFCVGDGEDLEEIFSFYTVYDDKDNDYSWHFLCSDGPWYEDYRGYNGVTWAPKKDPMNKNDAIKLYNKAAKIMSGEYDFTSSEVFCKEVNKRSDKLLSSLGMKKTDFYLSRNFDNRVKNNMWDVDIPKFDVVKRLGGPFLSLGNGQAAYIEVNKEKEIVFDVYSNKHNKYNNKSGILVLPVCSFFIEELDDGEYCFEINYYRSFWSRDGLTEGEAVYMFDKAAKIMSDSYPLNDTEWFSETVERNVKKVIRQLDLKKV